MPDLISIKGFTLLELLIVIAIAAVLMAIGVPNFSKWKEKHEINGQAQKVYSDMMLARSTSIKNNNNDDLFNELYPQYGGNFCQIIDHYNQRAEELINDFNVRH